MAVPGINFTIAAAQTVTPHSVDDVVFVIGEVGASGTGTVAGSPYENMSKTQLEGIIGTDGDARDFIDDVFTQIIPSVHFVAVASGATAAELATAMELAYDVSPTPTVLHAAGDLTAVANATTANALVTAMETIAEKLNCRGVANAAQNTVANGIAWGMNNGKPRIIGVFNQEVVSAGVYRMPAGAWLGGALAIAEEHGRAWGINLARVLGHLNLRHPLTPFSSQLTNLDAQGVSSIVSDQGLLKIIGDEFKPATATDPQRFWSIGRVVDHVEQRLTTAARGFIGSTYSADRIGIHLTRELNPLIAAGEILGGSVVRDQDQMQDDHKYLIAEIDLLFATNVITVRLNLVV